MKTIADTPADGFPAVVAELPKAPWWDVRGHLHRAHEALATVDPEANTLLSGRPVKLLFLQNIAWSTIAGYVVAVSIVAGWYYGGVEMHWYIHVGSFHWNGWTFKQWWDGGMHIGWLAAHPQVWTIDRHAIRNEGEPTVAWLFIGTLLAKARYWKDKASATRIVLTVPLLLTVSLALIVGETYLIYWGFPWAWAHAFTITHHPGFNLDGKFAWAGKASLEVILFGLVNSRILHRLWAPVGATLQGHVMDGLVRIAKATNKNRAPAYERLPIAPPTVRLRFATLWRGWVAPLRPQKITSWSGLAARLRAWFLGAVVLLCLISFILGILARFPIAHGVHIWYVNP